jgi:predicted metal-dependent phosphoesterase TrpH
MKKIRVELHSHTNYSRCSNIQLMDMIVTCKQKSIDCIAITDHNTIDGALKLREIAPDWLQIIIGEEISTKDGEIIGLFLSNKIDGKNKSMIDVINEIKDQNAISYLPHSFDKIRRGVVDKNITDKIIDIVDLFEIFNSRCIIKKFNDDALNYAKLHQTINAVGSDAHTLNEVGNAINIIENFVGKDDFLSKMKEAVFETHYSSILVHLQSIIFKLNNKLSKS